MLGRRIAAADLLFLWSLFRHHNFGSSSDLGAYHSVAWNFAMRGSLWNSLERIHHWSTHMEVGLLWLWLPYRFFASPVWLFRFKWSRRLAFEKMVPPASLVSLIDSSVAMVPVTP